MGFNTVLMVLNDTADMAAKDPEIGARIHRAMLAWHSRAIDPERLDVYFRTPHGGGGSYARVISQEHADWPQLVVVGGNCGYRICDAQDSDPWVIDQMKSYLERFGYRVQKMRKRSQQGA